MRAPRLAALALILFAFRLAWASQPENSVSAPSLPNAPQPQIPAQASVPAAEPCRARSSGAAALTAAATGAAASGDGSSARSASPQPAPSPALRPTNWYARFTDGPQVKPLTPKEKAWLAVRNVADPFNAVTILGSSAIAVGSDADSPYGPGMHGFGRYVGVSYTQDLTGEFFGTFLIPSIFHQDPHYHRMPNASIKRRIAHAIYQVAWTQGDNGKEMLNYANLVGFAIDDEIGNLYVPGRETNLPASAARYGTGLATAPIDNFITEFLPDIARRIHVRVVLIQRIINQVAKTSGPGQ
jgi:hypothetical protein